MNPNQMTYFNSLVLQHDFHEEARRSRREERVAESPAKASTAGSRAKGHNHDLLGFLHLALPGRR